MFRAPVGQQAQGARAQRTETTDHRAATLDMPVHDATAEVRVIYRSLSTPGSAKLSIALQYITELTCRTKQSGMH
jgi:hypothetical protein